MVEDINEVLPGSCTRENVNTEQIWKKNATSLSLQTRKFYTYIFSDIIF